MMRRVLLSTGHEAQGSRLKIGTLCGYAGLVSLLLSVLVGCVGMSQTKGTHRTRKLSSGGIEWSASFNEAIKAASAENKPMMLLFYGVSSRLLDRRVFSDPNVIELAQNFVSLKVGAGQDDLIQKYSVQEFPTVVFTDPQSGEYSKFVYTSGVSFVRMLESALIPLEAEYTLQIEPYRPKLASVKCVFRNVRQESLILVLRGRHEEVFNISYSSTDGQPDWERIEKGYWLMNFRTPALKTATIQYEVRLDIMSHTSYEPEYISYMGDDYGVLDGYALFLEPQDLHTTGKIEVHLHPPPGWRAITPWDKSGDTSYTAGSIEEVIDSVFCVGRFQSVKRHLGEHEIYAIHCGAEKDSPDLEQKADEIVSIFKDYLMRFGDFPFKRYLGVFAGSAPGGEYIHGSAHSLGFSGPVDVDYTFIAHEIFHVWNGGVINQKSQYEGWFKEGFTQYYGYLTPYRVGLYSEEQFRLRLIMDYWGYVKRYGTKDDMALTNVKEELARKEGHEQLDSARLWNMYFKGALVANLMNDEIKKRTSGIKTLDDLMNYMFHEFRDRKYSSEDVLEALNTVTGQDFTGFFADFVYGKTKLPSVTAGKN